MANELLKEWDGLMLTPQELCVMQASYRNGSYLLYLIAFTMGYPQSGMGFLFRQFFGGYWCCYYCHRDTAIALVRFIVASRQAREAREKLSKQVRVESLRRELAELTEVEATTERAIAIVS